VTLRDSNGLGLRAAAGRGFGRVRWSAAAGWGLAWRGARGLPAMAGSRDGLAVARHRL